MRERTYLSLSVEGDRLFMITAWSIPCSVLISTVGALSLVCTPSLNSYPAQTDGLVAPLMATADGRAVLAAWGNAQHRFTPEVKAAYLAWAKTRALEVVAKSGQRLPADFLAWVDHDPVVIATVYGISTNAAQRLAFLRSLEIDLGPYEVRTNHLQLALGLTDRYAGQVDAATLSSTNLGVRRRAIIT